MFPRPRFLGLVFPLLHVVPLLFLLPSTRGSCISAGCEFRVGRLLYGISGLLLLLRLRFLGLSLAFNQTRARFVASVLLLNFSRVWRGYTCLQQQCCVHEGVDPQMWVNLVCLHHSMCTRVYMTRAGVGGTTFAFFLGEIFRFCQQHNIPCCWNVVLRTVCV